MEDMLNPSKFDLERDLMMAAGAPIVVTNSSQQGTITITPSLPQNPHFLKNHYFLLSVSLNPSKMSSPQQSSDTTERCSTISTAIGPELEDLI